MCAKCDRSSTPSLGVDRSIVQRCAESATTSQTQSRESSVAVSPRTVTYDNLPLWPPKSRGPKSTKTIDVESGYGTDSDRSEKYLGAPDSPQSIEWTPVNTPKLACLQTYRFLQQQQQPQQQQPPRSVTSTLRALDTPSSSQSKRMTGTKRGTPDIEEASDVESPSGYSLTVAPALPKRRKISPAMTPETGAAYTLMNLNMADATLGERKPLKRRRVSA